MDQQQEKIKQRTNPQNRALHKLFRLWADSLNAHGKDMFTVLKDWVDIPWNKRSVEVYLWKPIEKHKESMKDTYNELSNELENYIEVYLLPTLDDLLQANSKRGLDTYFEIVAEALNDAGKDMRIILKKKSVLLWWDCNTVKDFLWRPIQIAQLQKKSTTELSTKEIDKIYDTANRHLSKHIPNIPFPNIEDLLYK